MRIDTFLFMYRGVRFLGKEIYKKPKLTLLFFEETDVICTSQFVGNDDEDLEWDWLEGGIL